MPTKFEVISYIFKDVKTKEDIIFHILIEDGELPKVNIRKEDENLITFYSDMDEIKKFGKFLVGLQS